VAIASVLKEIKQGVAPYLWEDSGATEFDEPSFDGVQPSETNRTFCKDCGKPISKRATSCPHCGTRVGDDDYGDEKQAKRRTHAEQATEFVDRTQKQLDKFGLGFLLNPRQFLDAEIYGFTDSDYPSLAAAVRYYAFLAKLVFYILRIVIVLYAVILSVLGTLLILKGGPTAFSWVEAAVFPVLVLLTTAMLLVVNNLGLILSLAACEMIRVWVRTERNTRTLNN
jgi:energy-converting hydrogenase Eha subunit A